MYAAYYTHGHTNTFSKDSLRVAGQQSASHEPGGWPAPLQHVCFVELGSRHLHHPKGTSQKIDSTI